MGFYSSCKALVIGVGKYADPQYDLSYARSDAEAMAGLLGSEFGFDQVWTLYDNDATRQNLIRFFEQDLQRTEEDDGLLIFFAGHGITVRSAIGDDRGFLVPHDGNPKEPYANISLASLRDDYLPMIPAKHVFLIVDACYGGLALRDVATVERPRTVDEGVLAELTRRDRKVRQVLAAGTKDQKVLDGGLFGHSVFTGRLIEALREANPYITADHVGVHVRERVARDSLDRKHRQTPEFGYLMGGYGNFVFCRGNAKAAVGSSEKAEQECPAIDVGPVLKAISAPELGWTCGKCGFENSPETVACPKCGERRRLKCHLCDAELEGNEESCTKCGGPFSRRAVYKESCEAYASNIKDLTKALGAKEHAGIIASASNPITLENAIERYDALEDIYDDLTDRLGAEYCAEVNKFKGKKVESPSPRMSELWSALNDAQFSMIRVHARRKLQLSGISPTVKSLEQERERLDGAMYSCAWFQFSAFEHLKKWLDKEIRRLRAQERRAQSPTAGDSFVCPGCGKPCKANEGDFCSVCNAFVHKKCSKMQFYNPLGLIFWGGNDRACPVCGEKIKSGILGT